MTRAPFWMQIAGRELDTTPLIDRANPKRIVACLNVWNDLGALQRSVPTWHRFVQHVIAVDGSYESLGTELSTDGTREYLQKTFGSALTLIDAPGHSQCDKRTQYLMAGVAGDYLLILDADEHLLNGEILRNLPRCDVGWVRLRSPIYQREYGQPRIIRWRPGLLYTGRHHWIFDGDRLLCTHQYGGPGYEHRSIPLTLDNQRAVGRSPARLAIKSTNLHVQAKSEAILTATPRTVRSDASLGAREGLWILTYAYRDDGIAPSRLHTAINRTTPHTSLFFKTRPGPFGAPTQFDARRYDNLLLTAINTADVVHLHTVVSMAHQIRRAVPRVYHHHGSILRANAGKYTQAAIAAQALVLVSNLELLSHTGDYPAFFLPNVVPVARYAALAAEHRRLYDGNTMFRVAHSPTHQHRKGTKQFLAVCSRLRAKGLPLEPVLIEGQSHADALLIKSTCHASFDSFWLGIQCSGLEAAAMGMPVVAGDATVAQRYREKFGLVPYTFADSEEELEHVLAQLVTNELYRATEAERVFDYVVANHDESAVALTYLDYLDMAFDWRAGKQRNGSLQTRSKIQPSLVHA